MRVGDWRGHERIGKEGIGLVTRHHIKGPEWIGMDMNGDESRGLEGT